jgi:hypothetical protein
MEVLNLPRYSFRIKQGANGAQIMDRCRRRYVKLTPEEWVRQNMVEYLITEKHYPSALVANEACIELNGMHKRCDTVIYDRNGTPKVIVEYKAPSVKITQEVFDQIAMYNYQLHVDVLIVSNGLNHFCCKVDWYNHSYQFAKEIPVCFF